MPDNPGVEFAAGSALCSAPEFGRVRAAVPRGVPAPIPGCQRSFFSTYPIPGGAAAQGGAHSCWEEHTAGLQPHRAAGCASLSHTIPGRRLQFQSWSKGAVPGNDSPVCIPRAGPYLKDTHPQESLREFGFWLPQRSSRLPCRNCPLGPGGTIHICHGAAPCSEAAGTRLLWAQHSPVPPGWELAPAPLCCPGVPGQSSTCPSPGRSPSGKVHPLHLSTAK